MCVFTEEEEEEAAAACNCILIPGEEVGGESDSKGDGEGTAHTSVEVSKLSIVETLLFFLLARLMISIWNPPSD